MKIIFMVLTIFVFSFADELRTLTNKGTSEYKKGNIEKALEYFSEAANKYQNSNEARFNYGLALGASGNIQEAETVLSSLNTAEALYARARLAEAMGDASQDKKAYMRARELYAQSLDIKKDKRTINNIEILAQKIKSLPEQEEEQEQEQDKNDDKDQNDTDEQQNGQKDEQQNEQEQGQNEEDVADAIRLIELYADDSKELNKPPVQEKNKSDEKDW